MPRLNGRILTDDQVLRIIDNRATPGGALPAPDFRPRAERRAEARAKLKANRKKRKALA